MMIRIIIKDESEGVPDVTIASWHTDNAVFSASQDASEMFFDMLISMYRETRPCHSHTQTLVLQSDDPCTLSGLPTQVHQQVSFCTLTD